MLLANDAAEIKDWVELALSCQQNDNTSIIWLRGCLHVNNVFRLSIVDL